MQPYPVRRLAIELGRFLVARCLRWDGPPITKPGYSIILGVPWDLRHLLPVNLRFINVNDRTHLVDIHVVFDRGEMPGMTELQRTVAEQYPDLPLQFHHYAPMHATLTRKLDTANFYNASNCAVGLNACRSRYAIIHDFDLYPVTPDYFEQVFTALRDRELRFCGLEHTRVDGMTADDNLLGTWCLGIDAKWLREHHRPIDIFHRIVNIDGKLIHLDPFSAIQRKTPQRQRVGTIDGDACCHVFNLPSTYLMFIRGRRPKIVWRLHYLWYLEDLADRGDRMSQVIQAMADCNDGQLNACGYTVDFNGVDPTCANVLRDDLNKMDPALFGQVRPIVDQYIAGFADFLQRCRQ